MILQPINEKYFKARKQLELLKMYYYSYSYYYYYYKVQNIYYFIIIIAKIYQIFTNLLLLLKR